MNYIHALKWSGCPMEESRTRHEEKNQERMKICFVLRKRRKVKKSQNIEKNIFSRLALMLLCGIQIRSASGSKRKDIILAMCVKMIQDLDHHQTSTTLTLKEHTRFIPIHFWVRPCGATTDLFLGDLCSDGLCVRKGGRVSADLCRLAAEALRVGLCSHF